MANTYKFYVIITLCAFQVLGNSLPLEKMYSKILNNNKNIPPNEHFTLHVTSKLSMFIDISEENHKLSTVILFNIKWKDKRYSWDHINGTADHSDLEDYLTLDDNLVWRPVPFLHCDKTGGSGRLSKIDGVTYLKSDGTIEWMFSQRLDTYCRANAKFHPFDIQQCLIELSFPDFPYMNVTVLKPDDLCMDERNGNWKITECDLNSRHNYLQFYLQFERISTRPMITLVLPVFTLTSMSPLVFLLPAEAGERTSLSLTTLLAISMYLTIGGDDLPKISDPLALIDIALCFWFVTNACTVLLLILNEKIYEMSERKPIPDWVHRIASLVCKSICQRSLKLSEVNPETKLKTDDEEEHHVIREHRITWKKLSQYLDKFWLIVIYILQFTLVVVVAFYLAYGDQTKSDVLEQKLTGDVFQGQHRKDSFKSTTIQTENEYHFFRVNAKTDYV